MKRKRFTDDQIIGILKEVEAGLSVSDLPRKHGISKATFYSWRQRYGGMELNEAKRLRDRLWRRSGSGGAMTVGSRRSGDS